MGGMTEHSTASSILGDPTCPGNSMCKGPQQEGFQEEREGWVGRGRREQRGGTQGGHWKRRWEDLRLHQGPWEGHDQTGVGQRTLAQSEDWTPGRKAGGRERAGGQCSGEGGRRPDQGNGCTDGLMRAGAKEIKR